MKYGCMALFLLLSLPSLWSVEVSITPAVFKQAEGSSYVEIHYRFRGNSVLYKETEAGLESRIKVMMTLEQGEEIKAYDYYRVNTLSEMGPADIVDIRRYPLPAGRYALNIEITDLWDTLSVKNYKEIIHIAASDARPSMGDILLVSEFQSLDAEQAATDGRAKYQMLLMALPYQFANKKFQHLHFYTEFYNMDVQGNALYTIRAEVIQAFTGNKVPQVVYALDRKRKAKDFDVYLGVMDLSKVPSGNYHLEVSVLNDRAEVMARNKVFFQRSHPDFDRELLMTAQVETDEGDLERFLALPLDTLVYSLKAISPLVGQMDGELMQLLINDRDKNSMGRYLSNHFAKEYPSAPFLGYKKFMQIARYADKLFNSGFRHGFETDRGRIFIRYGRPSDVIVVEDEVGAPPYEIWMYNEIPINNQTNVKFLFFNPDLVNNGHILLHSTARGEINNAQWMTVLYRNAPGVNRGRQGAFFEAGAVEDAINRRAFRFFNDI
jgi:GWxTD domain-containing protein